jgi:hypothetical protein
MLMLSQSAKEKKSVNAAPLPQHSNFCSKGEGIVGYT